MKIFLYIALFLCALLIITGAAVWFTASPIYVKILASSMMIGSGVAFGIALVEAIKEDD